jgi:hypothetical protein
MSLPSARRIPVVCLGWGALGILVFVQMATPVAASVIESRSTSQADVQAAVDRAAAGDTVSIPAGTSTWTTAVRVTKGIAIRGAGVADTILQDDQDRYDGNERPLFEVVLDADVPVEISDIHFREVRVNGTRGMAIRTTGRVEHLTRVRIHHSTFEGFLFALGLYETHGVCHDSLFLNNKIVSRVRGYYSPAQLRGLPPPPYAWDSPYAFVFEDCEIRLVAQKVDTYISDTEYPASYIYRHNRFDIDYAANVGVDGHDMHGETNDTQVRQLGIKIHDNEWFITGHTGVNPMNLTGVRGGSRSLVYNDVIHGLRATVILSDNPYHLPLMSETYVWNNVYEYGGDTSPFRVYARDGVTEGVNYFLHPPADFAELQYPHPLRRGEAERPQVPVLP